MESITDRALDMIYAMMPQLEELEVTNGSFTSAGLSGIPVINQGQYASSSPLRRHPHIGNLTSEFS